MSHDNTSISIKVLVPTTSKRDSGFYCYACHRLFRIEKELKDHDCIDTERYPYQCEKCGKYFQKKNRLKFHELTHDAPKKHICKEEGCGKGFTQLVYLKQHRLTHAKFKPFRCKLCGKSFKLPHFLKTHSYMHQTDATYVPVSEVNTRANDDSVSEEEEEKLVRVFTCEMCGKHFKNSFNLRRHSLKHTRTYKCVACEPDLHFDSVTARQDHYDTVHSGKPFTCNDCGRKFASPPSLKRHTGSQKCIVASN